MSRKYEKVYQFKITLEGIRPPVWRRIQVPETYTFWDLHVAIQDSMGWTDTHLHHFEIENPLTGRREEIGIPDDDFMELKIRPGWKRKIANYFSSQNDKAEYVYDYGDNWEHSILLEKTLPRKESIVYPVCNGGTRACPPEGFTKDEIVFDDPQKRLEYAFTEQVQDSFFTCRTLRVSPDNL
jgi:hypothetical protein